MSSDGGTNGRPKKRKDQSDIFKDPVNREIFMCYEPKASWSMVEEVAKLIVPGFIM